MTFEIQKQIRDLLYMTLNKTELLIAMIDRLSCIKPDDQEYHDFWLQVTDGFFCELCDLQDRIKDI